LTNEVGAWIGAKLLGPVGEKILDQGPPLVVRVTVPNEPDAASRLLFCPLELAHVRGKPLALQRVSLVFEVRGENQRRPERPVADRLRMLAVFSLPTDTRSLNLRQERYQLARLVRGIARRKGLALELRVLQYGVTRAALQQILEEGD